MEVLEGAGRFFYIVSQNGSTVETIEDVPDYILSQGTPSYYLTFIFIEFVILFTTKRTTRTRLNDSVVSISNGIYFGCTRVLVRGVEGYAYVQIYNNWRMCDLSWDSRVTWYLTVISVDFGYYWIHRASHEINLLWGAHQVHHSSEEFNLTTALRHSSIQGCLNWIFYLPLAFFVPPPIFLIHQQFNMLYQFWIHTALVESIGPLDYVLNTPKHHKIHHGSNNYCIDKNYGGVFIIWDRLFGSFADKKPDEKIIFGLVEHVKSFNPFYLQFYYFPRLLERIAQFSNIGDKLSVIFKGPSWNPGQPRLGDKTDLPQFPIRNKFKVDIPTWQNVYVLVNFIVILTAFDTFVRQCFVMNQLNILYTVFFLLFSLTSIGLVLENRRQAAFTEIFRHTIAIGAVWFSGIQGIERNWLLYFFGMSIFVWACKLFSVRLPSSNFVSLSSMCLHRTVVLRKNK